MVSLDTWADAISILFCSCRISPVGLPSNWTKQRSRCTGQHILSRNMAYCSANVRFWPKADIASADLEPGALPPGLTRDDLWEKLKSHAKGVAGLVGLFGRP